MSSPGTKRPVWPGSMWRPFWFVQTLIIDRLYKGPFGRWNHFKVVFLNAVVDLFIRDCIKTWGIYPAFVFQWLRTLRLLLQRAARSSVGAQPLLLTCPNHIKHSHSPHFFWSCTIWDACCFSPLSFSLFPAYCTILYTSTRFASFHLLLATRSLGFSQPLPWTGMQPWKQETKQENQFDGRVIYRKKVEISLNVDYIYSGNQRFRQVKCVIMCIKKPKKDIKSPITDISQKKNYFYSSFTLSK